VITGKQTLVRGSDAIEMIFQKQGIIMPHFHSEEDATVFLKQMFKDYENKLPELFEKNNRFKTPPTQLYKLFGINGVLRKTPYVGYQDET